MRGQKRLSFKLGIKMLFWLCSLSFGLWGGAPAQGAPMPAQAAQNAAVKPAPAVTARAAAKTQEEGGLHFRIMPYAESQNGALGYKARLDFLETQSALYPQALELGRFIDGQVLDALFAVRQQSAEQGEQNFCADALSRGIPCRNELIMRMDSAAVAGSLASVRYSYSYFPSGAAHPMNAVFAYNFSLKPLFRINRSEDLFTDADKAFPLLQARLRALLLAKRDEQGQPLPEKDMIWQGTDNWEALKDFALTKSGIVFIFSPYAVAPYAFGVQEAEIPYADVKALLKPFYRAALGLK